MSDEPDAPITAMSINTDSVEGYTPNDDLRELVDELHMIADKKASDGVWQKAHAFVRAANEIESVINNE